MRGSRWILMAVALALFGCGGSDSEEVDSMDNGGLMGPTPGAGGASNGGSAPGGPAGSGPTCEVDDNVFKVSGRVDGAAFDEERRGNTNAGFVNLGAAAFDTPFIDIAPLGEGEMELHLRWMGGLAHGASTDEIGGTFVLPAPHPRAGVTFCITAGSVGFSDEVLDEGAMLFSITGATVATGDALPEDACTGEAVSVELVGCYQ